MHGVGFGYMSRPTRGANGTPAPGVAVWSGLRGAREKEIPRLALKLSLVIRAASSTIPDSREGICGNMHPLSEWLAFERDVVSARPLISATVGEVLAAYHDTSQYPFLPRRSTMFENFRKLGIKYFSLETPLALTS